MDPYTAHMVIKDATIIAIVAIGGIGYPLARAYARRVENERMTRRTLPPPEAADARMERVERAVEAMAIEVERMAEGQRFITKLLADPTRKKPGDGV